MLIGQILEEEPIKFKKMKIKVYDEYKKIMIDPENLNFISYSHLSSFTEVIFLNSVDTDWYG
ncbi:hypothetical protein V1478_001183 [Vespula squamosa]|uniref:Uncharacterized protein n=1 Tax=Vespula squamosa TaxID=30214 RepID=A0ABD2C7M1_VESSQ